MMMAWLKMKGAGLSAEGDLDVVQGEVHLISAPA